MSQLGKRDFAVSANMAYRGQVNLYYFGEESGGVVAASGNSEESGEYEDPDRTDKLELHGQVSTLINTHMTIVTDL